MYSKEKSEILNYVKKGEHKVNISMKYVWNYIQLGKGLHSGGYMTQQAGCLMQSVK